MGRPSKRARDEKSQDEEGEADEQEHKRSKMILEAEKIYDVVSKPKAKAGEKWIICEIGIKLKQAKKTVTLSDHGLYTVMIEQVLEDGSMMVAGCRDGLVEEGVAKRRCLAMLDED